MALNISINNLHGARETRTRSFVHFDDYVVLPTMGIVPHSVFFGAQAINT